MKNCIAACEPRFEPGKAARHVYIIASKAPWANPGPEGRRLTSRPSYCWQMHDAQNPPTPSLHLRARSCRRMGTSDWSLPRVTSIAQAGGAARCSSAVAMAADKLLSCWMRGNKYTAHSYSLHLYSGGKKEGKKQAGCFRFEAVFAHYLAVQKVTGE